jgi:RND family efflux transporter MFP subunit
VAGLLVVPAAALANGFECLIEPTQVVEIRSSVEGLIDKIHVQRGDDVQKGQALVELESSAERSTVEAARYRSKMEGRLASARTRLEYATKKLERSNDLNRKQYIAAQARDEAETEKRLAESELKDATENRELAEREYRHAVDVLNLRTLRSPFAGVVVDRQLNPGDVAESGGSRKPILKLAKIDPLKVEVILPMEAYGKVEVGMTGAVTPESIGGRYTATVKVVDRVLDAASGTFGVRLEMSNPKGAVPGGVRCQVEFAALKVLPVKDGKHK